MKIISAVILTLGYIMIFSSCKDKDPTKPGYQRKPPKPEYYRIELGEAKSYLWAKPGSYWIYKNTKTGDLDTQIVTGFYFGIAISKGTEDYSKHITIEYDKLRRTIQSSFNKWIFYDETSKYNADATPFKGLFFALEHQAYGGEISAFHYPFNNNKISGTGAEITRYIGMDSNIVIQGKKFVNVVKFDVDFDAIDEKDCQYIPVTTYYWAKDVGLVKKTVNNCNYSWELVEYNIIQ